MTATKTPASVLREAAKMCLRRAKKWRKAATAAERRGETEDVYDNSAREDEAEDITKLLDTMARREEAAEKAEGGK